MEGAAVRTGAVPRVSVLMTVYNGLPYLPQAIESVLHQELADFEFLIIDDASTDGSVACVEGYSDPRIRLCRNERNMGQAWSLNRGLALAGAPYIARLDQDDICLPQRLQTQAAFLDQRRDIVAVGTLMYRMGADGRTSGVLGMRLGGFGGFLGALLSTAAPLGHPTVMYRREVILSVGGYDESFAPCEDYDLWCRLAVQRSQVSVIPEPLVFLRVHREQQSVQRQQQQQEHVRRAHARLVGTFCRPEETRGVSCVLQMGEEFWREWRTREQVRGVLRALEAMLATIRVRCELSDREARALSQAVSWWLGRRAFVAILHGHRQSRFVYAQAMRGGGAWWSAAVLAYPVCYLVSLVCGAQVREAVLRWAGRLNRQRYAVRLWFTGLRRMIGAARARPARVGKVTVRSDRVRLVP